MFGPQLRAARLELGLSEAALARAAGVQRSQVRDLERDINVSVMTLKKVLAQLPNITFLAVEPTARPSLVAGETVHQIARDLLAATHRLLALTGETAASTAPPAPPMSGEMPPDNEEVLHGTASGSSPEEETRLHKIEAALAVGPRPATTDR